MLDSYGNNTIKSITVLRKPIQSGVKRFINLVTKNGFDQAQKQLNYDQIYHLYINMTLDNGKTVGIEKNARINTHIGGFPTSGISPANMLHVPVNNIRLKDFIENGEKKLGDNMYRYNATSYNCQNFIETLMTANGIAGTNAFVMQDASKLITSSGLSHGAKVITDVAALGERMIKGHGTKGYTRKTPIYTLKKD